MKKQIEAWNGFKGTKWQEDINVREFIQSNYTMYDGDESFLAGPTEATALGNIVVAARGAGQLTGDLADLRAIVRRSTTLETYGPDASSAERWDAVERQLFGAA